MEEKKEVFLPEKDYGAQILDIIRGNYSDDELNIKLQEYHENDIACIFEELTTQERERLFEILDSEFMSEIVAYLDGQIESQYEHFKNIFKAWWGFYTFNRKAKSMCLIHSMIWILS